MTRSQAQQLWPVVREWCEGKTIQFRYLGSTGGWSDYIDDDLVMSNHHTEWRVKPTPREFWVVVDSSGRPCNAYTDPSLTDPLYKSGNFTVIHCIEVTTLGEIDK